MPEPILRRTAKAIQADIDAHLDRCGPCHVWFMAEDDNLDTPCSTMQELHDEYDRKVRGGRCICYRELFDGCPLHGDDNGPKGGGRA
jgi:hypothetical protein